MSVKGMLTALAAAAGMGTVHDVVEKPPTKIRYRVGKRYTYDPNRDAALGIKSSRPDPNGPDATYWPNGALKGTRTIGDKIIRRMFRRSAMTFGSRPGRRVHEAQRLSALVRKVASNPYESQRTLTKELAHRRIARATAVAAEVAVQP